MRDSFIFYRSFYEAINDLEDNQQLEIYQAMANFSLNFAEPNLSGVTATIFKLIKPQLEANNKRYVNGSKPKTKQDESKTEAKQKQDGIKQEANKNDNVNDNVNKNTYSNDFEKMFDWYRDNTDRPIGDKKKAYANYLKQLKKLSHKEIGKAVFNYVIQCKGTKTFTKHLVAFLNTDLEQYINHKETTAVDNKNKDILV